MSWVDESAAATLHKAMQLGDEISIHIVMYINRPTVAWVC